MCFDSNFVLGCLWVANVWQWGDGLAMLSGSVRVKVWVTSGLRCVIFT